MNKIYGFFIAFVLLFSGLSASLLRDFNFENDRMFATSEALLVISSYENEDFITAYTYSGLKLWDAPFHAKILSWRIVGNYVYVLSKHRLGCTTYVTCLDSHSGMLVWQRP